MRNQQRTAQDRRPNWPQEVRHGDYDETWKTLPSTVVPLDHFVSTFFINNEVKEVKLPGIQISPDHKTQPPKRINEGAHKPWNRTRSIPGFRMFFPHYACSSWTSGCSTTLSNRVTEHSDPLLFFVNLGNRPLLFVIFDLAIVDQFGILGDDRFDGFNRYSRRRWSDGDRHTGYGYRS